jgi:diguanylate cyclase (GGDEF)-like protein
MRTHAGHGSFDGALLLVDIDHFKQINDGRGHAVGDQALVETARRLMQAVREHDLVVRWGGEEFLVFAPRIAADQVDALAVRILHAVAGEAVQVADGPLDVTASIGYARCPLPPYSVSLTWEQAVNLADMALYTAKSHGRNRAVGITSCAAPNREALAKVEADFEGAWGDGRVSLRITPGPVAA